MDEKEKITDYLKQPITRRQAIKAGGIAALGLAFSKPIIDTIRPIPVFAAEYGPGPGPGPGPPSECCIDGKRPKAITFRYTGEACKNPALHDQKDPDKRCKDLGALNGTDPVQIIYVGKDRDKKISVFGGGATFPDVFPDEEITIEATGRKDLHADTKLDIIQNGVVVQQLSIHTSCSQPLALGNQFGSLTVVDCDPVGVIGGPCEGGKPSSLAFTYTGLPCAFSSHLQGSKAECTGTEDNPIGTGPVTIVPIGKSSDKIEVHDPPALGFNVGDTVIIVAKDVKGRKKKRLPSNTELEIRQGGELLQTLKIHTSCSQPLAIGDQFGGLQLGEFNPLALIPSLCDDLGKPKKLTFIYTGEDCDASDNDQGKKAKCYYDPKGVEPVEIVYTGKDDNKIKVVEVGDVIAIGGKVTVDAFDKDQLHANTKLEIRKNGILLQKLEIHTSCSRPLDIGDQFGSLKLVEFVSKSGGIAPTP